MFSYEEIKGKDGVATKKRMKGFPIGCLDCPNKTDADCHESCLWPENYWKYEEVKYMWLLAKALKGGMDLNRIASLELTDFIKISIVGEYL